MVAFLKEQPIIEIDFQMYRKIYKTFITIQFKVSMYVLPLIDVVDVD